MATARARSPIPGASCATTFGRLRRRWIPSSSASLGSGSPSGGRALPPNERTADWVGCVHLVAWARQPLAVDRRGHCGRGHRRPLAGRPVGTDRGAPKQPAASSNAGRAELARTDLGVERPEGGAIHAAKSATAESSASASAGAAVERTGLSSGVAAPPGRVQQLGASITLAATPSDVQKPPTACLGWR